MDVDKWDRKFVGVREEPAEDLAGVEEDDWLWRPWRQKLQDQWLSTLYEWCQTQRGGQI